MAVIEGGVSGTLAGVGLEAGSPQHVTPRPLSVGLAGHYRVSHRTVLVNAQAATSRLFELRNASATDLLVLMRLRITWVQTAAHTAAIENSLDIWKATAFTAVSTTNATTLTASKLRTSFGTSNTLIRGLTATGAAAGMTGSTATKDSGPLTQLPLFALAAVPTASPTPTVMLDYTPSVANGGAPLILAPNEGLLIDSRVAMGAAAGSSVYIVAAFAETSAY